MLSRVWSMRFRVFLALKVIIFLFLSVFCSPDSLAADSAWKEKKGEHFIVYHQKAPSRFVDSVLNRAEEIYRKSTQALGFTRTDPWTWDERVRIYIYDDQEDYQASGAHQWTGGMVWTGEKRIATYPSDQGFFDSLLPHEIGHIVFRDAVGRKADVPVWFEEGVAVFQEEAGGVGADARVREALRQGKFIGLRDLGRLQLTASSDKDLVRLFYAEAASIVSFLIENGERYRFSRFCDALKSGMDFEKALKKSYMKYPMIEDLEEEWKGFLAQ
ncbi:MAG: hypothetical protein GX606_04150 [Elusimicrobia bacterium]|nr:hypothetical protein [Elusimicrobiota bacterium]